jgi:hypothetical protein
MTVSARTDLITGVVILSASGAGLYDVLRRAPVRHGMMGDPGPTFLPSLLLYLLLALGAALVLKAGVDFWRIANRAASERSTRTATIPREGEVSDRSAAQWAQRFAPPLMVGSLVVYISSMPVLGFVTATFAFLAGWGVLIYLIESRERPWMLWRAIVEAAAVTALLVFMFGAGLRVPLP